MSKVKNYTGQRYKQDVFSKLKEWYSKNRNEGYYITQATHSSGKWLWVMTKGSEITSQGYAWATNANVTQKIKQIWNEGDPPGTSGGVCRRRVLYPLRHHSQGCGKAKLHVPDLRYLGLGFQKLERRDIHSIFRRRQSYWFRFLYRHRLPYRNHRQQYYQRYWQAFLEAEQSQRRLCGLCSKPRRLHRCNCSEPLHNLRWKQSMPCLQRTGRSYGSCLWRHVVSLQILRRKQNMPELPGTGVYHTDQPFPERSKHRLRPKRECIFQRRQRFRQPLQQQFFP